MGMIAKAAVLVFAALGAGCAHQPPAASGWTLAWSDEFEGDALDRGKWVAEAGGHGWGNQGLRFYSAGNPDSTTVLPRQMLADYVRVYRRAGKGG